MPRHSDSDVLGPQHTFQTWRFQCDLHQQKGEAPLLLLLLLLCP